jgi:hypothetical protein
MRIADWETKKAEPGTREQKTEPGTWNWEPGIKKRRNQEPGTSYSLLRPVRFSEQASGRELLSPSSQSAIRNPQSAIRNPNPQSAFRNPQSAIRNPNPQSQSAIPNPQSAIDPSRLPATGY